MSGGQGHNSGGARLRSFIDRVLRLKEEQDALAADIREVYAEAKGEGYDKTAMGELVAYLRKVEKKGADAVAEKSAIFDLYKDAYESAVGTPIATHVHAREAVPDHDAETGEIRDASQPVEALSEVALPTTGDDTELSGSGMASGTGSAGGEGSTPSGAPDFQPPAFLTRESKPLRPHCLHPENCGGYGTKHCHTCLKVRDEQIVGAET
jgi:uncharacterized protein (UPF0335 family)